MYKLVRSYRIQNVVRNLKTVPSLAGVQNVRKFTKVPSPNELPRPAGISSMFRLPVKENAKDLDIAFIGVPFDSGTTYRPGTRFGPRQIRWESCMIKPFNKETGAAPYESLRVADIGDVSLTMQDTKLAVTEIKEAYSKVVETGAKPITLGGDHTITYPILQALKERYGPVGMIHIDAHTDTAPASRGYTVTHGTPFYRAVEEGLLDCKRVVQIGLRGSGYTTKDYQWGIDQGFRVVPARECWHKSLVPLMSEVREQLGDGPVYISFDIDGLDPAYAPGTGTLEIGGLTSIQGLEIVRGAKGLNIVGCDLVEVSPPYDQNGTTALTAANLLFEMLCVMPGVKYEEMSV